MISKIWLECDLVSSLSPIKVEGQESQEIVRSHRDT